MNKEDIKYYKLLYLNEVNKENYLDCIELLELYKFYLSVFIDENENFYMNTDFLRYVVNEFTYYYNMIFDNEEKFGFDVKKFYFENYERLYTEGKNIEWSIEDLVSAATYLVNSKLLHEGLAESYIDIVRLLVDNNYRISKVMSKKIDRTS